jgi:membrane protease YdiL (CAAX protease family)
LKSSYINLHPALKLAMTAFVALSSLLVVMIIGVVVAIPFSGTDIFSFLINNNAEYSADNIAFLKYLQIIQSIGLFIVPSVILAFLFGNNASKYLKVNVVPYPQGIILAISIIIIASPLINVIGEFNSKMVMPEILSGVEKWMRESEDAAGEITNCFKHDTISGLLVNILMIGIIPAIGEELLFRGNTRNFY